MSTAEERCVNCGKTFGEHFALRCVSGSDASIWKKEAAITPKDHEEYVRSRWIASIGNGGLYLYEGARSYHLRLGNRNFDYTQKHKDECWSAAYAFTLEREEQIRLIEEEIKYLDDSDIPWVPNGDIDITYAVKKRILAREQAALAELRKGMRQ